MAQHDRSTDENYRIMFGISIITSKLSQQKSILQRFYRNHPNPNINNSILFIETILSKLSKANSIKQLMGFEGVATRAYFQSFSRLLLGHFEFHGRNRRPPKDPVNAMLSFGYTLLVNELTSLLESSGFDCFLGILHGFRYGRQSLPLDIIEEFRHSIVDRFVLSTINRQQFHLSDFQNTETKGVRFNQQALKKFLRLWEERMRSPVIPNEMSHRECFQKQVLELEEALIHGRIYQPSKWKF